MFVFAVDRRSGDSGGRGRTARWDFLAPRANCSAEWHHDEQQSTARAPGAPDAS